MSGNGSNGTTALVPAGHAAVVMTKEQVDLVKRTVFPDATMDELQLYFHDCTRQGIHPLDRLIHPQIRKDKNGNRRYIGITSIDLMRSRAEEAGGYAGQDEPVFSGTPKGDDFACRVTVYKMVGGQRCPFAGVVRWAEFKPPSGQDAMWQRMPHNQLAKCGEAQALRKAFPRNLSGMYVPEEMEQSDTDRMPAAGFSAPPPATTPANDGDFGTDAVADLEAKLLAAPDADALKALYPDCYRYPKGSPERGRLLDADKKRRGELGLA
jgi:phage recombination protein Bet